MSKKVLIPQILLILFCALLPSMTSAVTVPDTVKAKAALEGIYQCYYAGAYVAWFNASAGGEAIIADKKDGKMVKLPYGLTNASDNNTNCKEIFKGFGDDNNKNNDKLRNGLMPDDIWSSTDITKVKNYFAGANGEGGIGTWGFAAEPSGNVSANQTTYQLKIKFDTNGPLSGDGCQRLVNGQIQPGYAYFYTQPGGGGKIDALVFPTITKDNTGDWFFGDAAFNSNGVNVPIPGDGQTMFVYFCNDRSYINIIESGGQSSPYYTFTVTNTTVGYDGYRYDYTMYPLVGDELVMGGGDGWTYTRNTRFFVGTQTEGTVTDPGSFDDYKLTYRKLDGNNYPSTYMRSIKKIDKTNTIGYNAHVDTENYSELALSDEEVYALYTYYVKDVFQATVACEGDSAYATYDGQPEIKWVAGKTCKIYKSAMGPYPSYEVYGVNSANHFTEKITIDNVISTLNRLPDSALTETGGNAPDEPGSGEDEDTSDVTDGVDTVNCYTAGGSLGWVLCPILNFLAETVNSVYDSVVEPYLRMDVALLNTNDAAGQATLSGWRIFQNIANILLVVFFIVIIASQLTGVGINNYGIKKSLPKVIIAAVLINLSFIICQLAVDASNIVGSSVKALFDSMGDEIQITSIKYGEGSTATPVNTTGMNIVAGAVGILATLVFGAAALYIYGAAILIPLLVGALSVFISIFFVFILLSIRKAAVIILTAISPLAFAMYMLPNTKRLFDKWVKAFEGLLLLYPIAGALIGGGNFASRLLLMSGAGEYDFFFALSAMIIGIVPIFFIPTLLKQSFAAMGNIGARISGIGTGASRGLGRNIRNSQWARGLNEDQMRTMARRRSGLNADGTLSTRGKLQNKRHELADKARKKNKILGGVAGLALGASSGSQRRLNNMRAGTLENIAREGDNQFVGEGSEEAIENRRASAEADREAREVKDTEASIINKGQGNDIGGLQKGLREALQSGDTKKVKAYQNILSRKGESGRQAVHNAMAEAEKAPGGVNQEARRAYANNLMDNWAKDYKDNSRSTFEFAQANTGENFGGSVESHSATKATSLTQSQMAQMDTKELDRYIDKMQAGDLTQQEAKALYDTAVGACTNKDLEGSMKAEQRSKLRTLAAAYKKPAKPFNPNPNNPPQPGGNPPQPGGNPPQPTPPPNNP